MPRTDATILEALAAVLEAAAAKAREIAQERPAERSSWVDQHTSPLGPRRHCVAVRRRIQSGDTQAAIVGRRQLLSAEALDAELQSLGRRHAPGAKESVTDELREELGLPRR